VAKILTIIGMHRTGTSLLARYLRESGLFMGAELLGPHESNPAGHFEDREFLSLHNSILATQGLDYKVTSEMKWNPDEATLSQAQALIRARNSIYPQWGWKDPRTCLFLPFWKSLLPDCHFIVTYRHYLPVIGSMISRDIEMYREKTSRLQRLRQRRFRQDEIERLGNEYLKVWIWYNSEIIRHILDDPAVHFTLISFEQLIPGETQLLDQALQQSGFHLQPPRHFETIMTRSVITKNIALNPDAVLVSAADKIHSRFSALMLRPNPHVRTA
jgi:hypothetical protein